MNRLKEKVALVTGAADGIGLAVSEAFVEEGAKVIMCDINIDKCNDEAAILNDNGGTTRSYQCDVGVTKDVENVVAKTLDEFGRIDILVNNVGVAISGNITEMPEEDWDKVMNINLKSVYRGIKTVLPHMLQNKSGSIINISSVQGHRSWDDWTAYASSKGAMLSMTRQLAGQFGQENIRFNAISPGAILTPMNRRRLKEEGSEFVEKSINQAAMKRLGTSKEVAMTAVFLASDEASFITGEDIKVDGGLCVLPRYL
ncbi:SDR family NAD(P)-dependent oxidoreductase [Flagellimonas nanhaiensis]|uniref:SDR family NAD(P)-dependent oxidoreductase n=1 Tax=Flagellimonas nanhaiensis TaxID=2292706 RepID=A0A371JTK9_9FLAO|nr:SDR family oxidoreductase [Allomuricauda nanhaiensis]RDY61141.1 SDR family NAD(P)-dependent oxidoreductase [Allomuricauda nanhaiensis]